MKVFISWSGETSHKIALVFRQWLPTIIPDIDPWVSSEDIRKGKRWSKELADELEDVSYGIFCVDASNIQSPWLNFEAGVISKQVSASYVAPLLFHIKPSDLIGPLSLFQATNLTKDDVYKLLLSLNDATGTSKLRDEKIRTALDFSWATLETTLNAIPLPNSSANPMKTEQGIKTYKPSEEDIEIMKCLAAAKEARSYWVDVLGTAELFHLTRNRADYLLRNLEKFGLVQHHYIDGTWGIQDKGLDYLIRNDYI